MKPVVVVVVCWNSWEFLEKCLAALAVQTFTDFSVVVFDNGSAQSLPGHLPVEYPDVIFRRSETNLGFAVANNLVADSLPDHVRWMALLNPDAFAEPGWLAALLRAASQYPDCVAFGSKLLSANNPDVLDGIGDAYRATGRVSRRGHGQPVTHAPDCVQEVFSPCAAAALYRRDVFCQQGGFDVDFFCYVEDVDLGFRLRIAGYRALYVPDSVVHHWGSGTTDGQHGDFATYHGHRNLVWTFVKNMPWPLLVVLMPLHIALNVSALAYLAWRGQAAVGWRAKRDAIAGLPTMWAKRRVIQRKRRASVLDVLRAFDARWFARY